MRAPRRGTVAALLTCLALIAGACSSSGSGGSGGSPGGNTSPSGAPHRGGSLVVLERAGFQGDWAAGLDPSTSASAVSSQYQAIFGGLFLLRADADGSNAKVVPNQASAGSLSDDGKTLTVKLRSGIKFSDGTPLDAKAVIWNFARDTASTCTCAPKWQVRKTDPFTSPDPLTVVVHLTQPNVALLHNLPALNVNWIVSPTAFKKMGAKAFSLKPVGAGPFTVVSDQLSSKLVLKRNPDFFKKGKPYLDGLTFESIGDEQPAYQAMLAGQADAYEGMLNYSVMKQVAASPKLQLTRVMGTDLWMVHFNTNIAPFNNIKAREAMYYATDWEAIDKGLFGGKETVVQGFTTPADLYYHKTVPGYRTYDLAKAKQLVKELGGLSFELDTTQSYTTTQLITALQSQWQKAGMKVTLKSFQLSALIKRLTGGQWQAEQATAGAWDPAVGVGIGFRFSSTSPYTGVKDPHLDKLLQQAVSTAVDSKRDKTYQELAKYISDQAYSLFGFEVPRANAAVKGVHAPGLTTLVPPLSANPQVVWSEAWTENG
jgi:peptide/nickel transport system substrate-binding protein